MNVETIAGPPAADESRLPPPSWRLLIALSLPVLAQQGLAFLVLLWDRFLAGNLPDTGHLQAIQSAQTTAHYLAWFISCYNVLVTVGSTALVARCIGAGERRLAVEVTHQALILALILGVFATGVAFGGGIRWMVAALKLEGAAADYATDYLHFLFASLVFMIVEVAGIACLVGAGDTRTGLWVTGGIAFINVPLAWGFGWGIGPFPDLGFVGIAVGTSLSHVLGGLAILGVLIGGRFGLQLELGLFRPRFDLLYRLLRISIPAGFDSLSIVVGQLWFLRLVNGLGVIDSAAHGIALVWEGLGYLSGAAFGTAAMALVGQNLGARRPDQATRAGWMAFALACGVMTMMGATFCWLARPMFGLFCPKPEQADIIEAGVPVLQLIAFAMPPLASAIVFTNALRGAGDTRVPVIFTWIGFFAVRIPLAYFLAFAEVDVPYVGYLPGLDWGLYGCWLAMIADLILRGVFFLARFAHGGWQKQKV
jgi:putative MATE family efflux protein